MCTEEACLLPSLERGDNLLWPLLCLSWHEGRGYFWKWGEKWSWGLARSTSQSKGPPEFWQAKVNAVFNHLFWDVSRRRRAQSQPESPCCLQKNRCWGDLRVSCRFGVWEKREAFWHAAVQDYTWCVINAFPWCLIQPALPVCQSLGWVSNF